MTNIRMASISRYGLVQRLGIFALLPIEKCLRSWSFNELSLMEADLINPTISVVTVALNAEAYIEQTISSVINQRYCNKEYIVVDGGSTDKTLEILRKYESGICHWVSETDSGIADAMNKGLSMASGDYIIFLHSDDYFLDNDVLNRAVSAMRGTNDIYAFAVIFMRGNNYELKTPFVSAYMHVKTGILHQGAICSRQLCQRLAGFDTQFKIAMDYDFFLRAYKQGATFELFCAPLSVMRDTGISSRLDWQTLSKRFAEERLVHRKNCDSVLLLAFYMVYWPLYLGYRRVKSLILGR